MPSPEEMLAVAIEEARTGLAEGGIPIGSALFAAGGTLLGRGHNRRVQHGDPTAHAEVDAFRAAGRRPSYRDTVMITTLAPCWYCSGLVRQFAIPRLIARRVAGPSRAVVEWLRSSGVDDRSTSARGSAPTCSARLHRRAARRLGTRIMRRLRRSG